MKRPTEPLESFLTPAQASTYATMRRALTTRFGGSQWYDSWLDRRSNWFNRQTPRELIEKGQFDKLVELMKLTGVL